MRRRFPVILLLLLAACSGKKERPADILPPERMTKLLRQMITADELVAYRVEKDSGLNTFNASVQLYRSVFRSEGVSEADFKKSLRYYQDRPQELRPVLDSLQKQPGLDTITMKLPPRMRRRKPSNPF